MYKKDVIGKGRSWRRFQHLLLCRPSSGTADPPANTGSGTTTHGTHSTLEAYGATFLFDKQLTTSDAGGHGRVVIPKASSYASGQGPPIPKLEQAWHACVMSRDHAPVGNGGPFAVYHPLQSA